MASKRILIIGPGRRRQGTGPFVARYFYQSGIEIAGLVSSSLQSAEEASKLLADNYGISAVPYDSSAFFSGGIDCDLIAICSPAGTHLEYLEKAVELGLHVFCEKPLWWLPEWNETGADRVSAAQRTGDLLDRAESKGLAFHVNTQWPYTLRSFYTLHPDAEHCAVESLEMLLSPDSEGPAMLCDSAPHLLSLLYSLLGSGEIGRIEFEPEGPLTGASTIVRFRYEHSSGVTDVSLELVRTDEQPKPAAYGINGRMVRRAVELPNYDIFFETDDRRIRIPDPLERSISHFLEKIEEGRPFDKTPLIDGMMHLVQLHLISANFRSG